MRTPEIRPETLLLSPVLVLLVGGIGLFFLVGPSGILDRLSLFPLQEVAHATGFFLPYALCVLALLALHDRYLAKVCFVVDEAVEVLLSFGPVYLASFLSLAALGEELLFRGFLQEGASRLVWFLSPEESEGKVAAWAIFFSAAAFAFIHQRYRIYPAAFVAVFLVGLFLGWSYAVSRNLWIPVILHALWNAGELALYIIWRGREPVDPRSRKDVLWIPLVPDAHDDERPGERPHVHPSLPYWASVLLVGILGAAFVWFASDAFPELLRPGILGSLPHELAIGAGDKGHIREKFLFLPAVAEDARRVIRHEHVRLF
ncbi:membrane protease YdiL (CAAX protease family) [Brockia lithotrophica]|uniref:Membrane protease YdiL (CAAX protease family) n=1 Tax=Brockia lithotrophica TaxID=933949 RepID=A0A660LA50_9BACL|nr:membrane protease YdiL (CAAX protease family) [Brockia lithotrophica]